MLCQVLLPQVKLLVDPWMLATKILVVERLPSMNLVINDSESANSKLSHARPVHRFIDVLLSMESCFPEIHEASLIGVVIGMTLRFGIHHAVKACIDVVAIPQPSEGHGVVVLGNFVGVVCSLSLGIIIRHTMRMLRRTFRLEVVLLFRRVGRRIDIVVNRLGSDRGRGGLWMDLFSTLRLNSRHYES
jgi:hypothetical protein